MYPEIFHLPFLWTYGVLVALAFLTALWLAGRLARRAGLNADDVTNLGIYCALAGIGGAKLMMFLVDIPYYTQHPGEIFSLATLQAGGVFYGGLIAALVVAAWYMRKTRLPLLKTADVFAPAVAIGHGIGRLGCFSAGCCWGVECHLPWAVTFRNPVANQLVGVPLGVPLHPTQLYEAFAEFAIFALLYWRIQKPHATGAIISLYLVLYSSVRFIVEFFRNHEQGNLLGGPLDTSQWISLALLLSGRRVFPEVRQACCNCLSARLVAAIVPGFEDRSVLRQEFGKLLRGSGQSRGGYRKHGAARYHFLLSRPALGLFRFRNLLHFNHLDYFAGFGLYRFHVPFCFRFQFDLRLVGDLKIHLGVHLRGSGAVARAHLLQHLIEKRLLAKIYLGRRGLLMPEIMIAVAGPAPYLRRFALDHRDYVVVHDALAAHAKIVNVIAQTRFTHGRPP